uniref:PIPK domain-containing protein n=1 Tax=Cyclophora tenuis TaxID=216820 RepID=A0A7S1GMN7_CYCTE
MTNAESKFLRRILPHYFRHCSRNPNTLITKFLGMYRVKLYHLRRNVKFVIMNSVYHTDKVLHSFYDLKGSVSGRDAKPHHDVKKDNDLRRVLPQGALALSPELRSRVRQQIVADCNFMRKMKIMDYSMLVGIHNIPPKTKGKTQRSPSKRGFRFSGDHHESFKIHALALAKENRSSARSHDDSRKSESLLSGLVEKQLSAPEMRDVKRDSAKKMIAEFIEDDSGEIEKQFSLLYEYGVDDDDDNSYLEGSDKYVAPRPPTQGNNSNLSEIESMELKKIETIEQVYWPFHEFFDIYGCRLMAPRKYRPRGESEGNQGDEAAPNFTLSPFVPPLSDRKDGGLEMDVVGLDLPVTMKAAQNTEQLCDGRIFFMGIIDILQQYNIRKRVEARYRRAQGSGWHDASCVHPNLYAERFIHFFDEYSQRVVDGGPVLAEGEEGIIFEAMDQARVSSDEKIETNIEEQAMGDSEASIEVQFK